MFRCSRHVYSMQFAGIDDGERMKCMRDHSVAILKARLARVCRTWSRVRVAITYAEHMGINRPSRLLCGV